MSFVRTALGDIPPRQLGVCYSHEHLIIDRSYATCVEPDFLLDSVSKAVQELTSLKALGVQSMVDSMPCAAGRNVLKLAELSRRTGIQILCPTGVHLEKYYPPGHWSDRYSCEQIAQLFCDEISEGIDAHDYGGPIVVRSPYKAGLIKVATGGESFTIREENILTAAALAHEKTGCPILTHTEQGEGGLEQLQFFSAHGVNPSSVILSHLDRNPDREVHRDALEMGAFLEFDSAFRWKEKNQTLSLIVDLIHDFPDQLLLGMDAARRKYWKVYGGAPGLAFLWVEFRQTLLNAGLSAALVDKLFIANPARAFAFVSPELSSQEQSLSHVN
jgi:phosphotriesterase-related protein